MRKIKTLTLLSVVFVFSATASFAQQTDRDLYVGLYQRGEFDKAVVVLKRLTKEKGSDGDAWYYLGLTSLKLEKEKDAVKALQKAASLKPTDATVRAALAYAYLLRNDKNASVEANETLKLNPNSAEAHYVLGMMGLRDRFYNTAYERAAKAIEIDPKMAPAYFLKSQAMVSSFGAQTGTVIRPKSVRYEMLKEAASDLEKYLQLTPKSKQSEEYQKYLESIKLFAEHYGRPENQKTGLPDNVDSDTGRTPLKIISKPRPGYTDRAREANVSGVIRLLVGFGDDSTVKHIMILTSLGYGLDEQALWAAKQIKFAPPTQNGKPVSTVKVVEYYFEIY